MGFPEPPVLLPRAHCGAGRARRVTAGAVLLVALTACGAPAPVAPPVVEGVAVDAGATADLYDARYCEILVANRDGREVVVDVYNTIGLNDCPPEQWAALDTGALAEELGATAVNPNGPRHWVISSFENSTAIDRTPRQLGPIVMSLAGRVSLPVGDDAAEPYVERSVARDTTFVYDAGTLRSELVDPAGTVYVMQSYSQQIDPTLTLDALPDLGDRLDLPEGWEYRSGENTERATLDAVDGTAYVVTDELGNTYQRQDAAG